jgi:hypothetical protein
VSEIHAVVLHIELPSLTDWLNPVAAKLAPDKVKLVPPEVAPFTSRIEEITGESKEKTKLRVPTTAAMLTVAPLLRPAPGLE